MTKEQIRKELETVCDGWLDTVLDYFDEYGQYMERYELAAEFSKAFHDMVWKVEEELEANDKGE